MALTNQPKSVRPQGPLKLSTRWDVFKQAGTCNNTPDLQENTESVIAYITKCPDDLTGLKTITVRANLKLWLTGSVSGFLKARNAFRAGDQVRLTGGNDCAYLRETFYNLMTFVQNELL